MCSFAVNQLCKTPKLWASKCLHVFSCLSPQPKVFVQVRNRVLGSVLTTESKDCSFPAKVFLSPADRSLDTQCWIFTDGLLKNTVSLFLTMNGPENTVLTDVMCWESGGFHIKIFFCLWNIDILNQSMSWTSQTVSLDICKIVGKTRLFYGVWICSTWSVKVVSRVHTYK